MRPMTRTIFAVALAALTTAPAPAQVLTQWNFNGASSTDASSLPSIGSGTAALIGGTTATFASGTANGGSTDPVTTTPPNYGWNTTTYPAQGTNDRTAGVQFAVSTAGFENVSVSWDQRHSNTSSRFVQFQYSTDGNTFTDFGSLFEGTAGDTWFNNRSVDLTSITAVNDNPNFAFRIVSAFSPSLGNAYAPSNSASTYAGSGTWRFDMVTINASVIPEPSSFVLAGLAAAGIGRRLMFRRK